ncbi:helix-turn-helix transcriptional regulator [Paenibacillus sp. GCM10027626]|uniref:helix-turn-helix transcriptional regulator n=1 Tax=Paenibacillus sp. GCM10027626 TaxID=3273411 RepID=UPI0036455EA2
MSLPDFHHNFDLFFEQLSKSGVQAEPSGFWRLQPRPDMELVVSDYDVQRERHIGLQPVSAMVELNCLLQGSREVTMPGVQHEATAGSCSLEFVTPTESRLGFTGQSRFQMLSIAMPVATFQHLMASGNGERTLDFAQIVGARPFRAFQFPCGPVGERIASRLLEAVRAGRARNLELECLMLELLAESCRSCLFDEHPQQVELSVSDCDKLYQAKQIMQRNMIDPPTLMELARMIGMNDYKLKVGFKELFGITVFGYLRDYRLEQALIMLQSGGSNVNETACAVGYSNPSYFAEAFREKYGVNPGVLSRKRSAKTGKAR